MVLRNYIQRVAKAAGISKKIGSPFGEAWHRSWLPRVRRSILVQKLLRHSNSSITLDLHQQAEADAKCSAQDHVADLFRLSKASNTTMKTEEFSGNGGLSVLI